MSYKNTIKSIRDDYRNKRIELETQRRNLRTAVFEILRQSGKPMKIAEIVAVCIEKGFEEVDFHEVCGILGYAHNYGSSSDRQTTPEKKFFGETVPKITRLKTGDLLWNNSVSEKVKAVKIDDDGNPIWENGIFTITKKYSTWEIR